MIISSAPPERAGAAAAISETSGELGGVLGIAIMGSIGTAVYRRAPEAARRPISSVTRAAFVRAFELTAAIDTVIVLLMAVIAVVMLRRKMKDEG